MSLKLKTFATLSLAAALVAGIAEAQSYGFGAGPGWGRGGMMMNGPGRGRFPIIDADENGVISAEEAASAAEEVFAAMDSDDNAELTKDEYMAVRMGPQEGWNKTRQAAREKEKGDRFGVMDTDKNDSVSQAEFIANAKARFEAADGDKDGKVTPWEWRSQQWN
ncbi:EF-hand domain-containing protein [Rhizobium sp. CAU 1783]